MGALATEVARLGHQAQKAGLVTPFAHGFERITEVSLAGREPILYIYFTSTQKTEQAEPV